MNNFTINPYIRLSIHSILNQSLNMRIILDYELVYIKNGELLLNYNGTPFHFHSGDVLLLCPGIPHAFTCITPEIEQPHIHFDLSYDRLSPQRFISFQDYSSLTADERSLIQPNAFPQLSNNPLLSIKDKDVFLKNFYSIIDSNDHHSLNCKSKILELLDTIIKDNKLDTFSTSEDTNEIISLVKNYIDSNYEHNFQLSDLEKQFSYSKFYMDRLFRQETGTSIIKYRNRLRLINSIALLGKHSVTETAQMLGFSSIYTFSRAFRAFYGESPMEYICKLHKRDKKIE